MTYITVCDARHPVPISISEGNSISMTSMSLIYDFYNINNAQEILRYEIKTDDDDKPVPFEEHEDGIDIVDYYNKQFERETKRKAVTYSYEQMITGRGWDNYYHKIDQFKTVGHLGNKESISIGDFNVYNILIESFISRMIILSYYKFDLKVKYVYVNSSAPFDTRMKNFKCPSYDSGIDDYIHERVIRDFPLMFLNNDTYAPVNVIKKSYKHKTDTIDNMSMSSLETSNRRFYHQYILNSKKCFEPSIYFDNDDNMRGVFIFLRVNEYIHKIINFIRKNDADYYRKEIANSRVAYYDKSNISNETLKKIIDNGYGGDGWKCFKPGFVDRLEQIIYTSYESQFINPGFYSLTSLLNFHFESFLDFDYNKYTIKIKEDNSVSIVRPGGSNKTESHGELYDLLWSKDSGRRFPDIIGPMMHINVHCEQINALESVFIDHDGNQRHNKMIGTIKINPSDGEFFDTRNEYDNERRIYFKLASPIKHITHLNFYFTDCDGKRITLNGPVLLNLVIQ